MNLRKIVLSVFALMFVLVNDFSPKTVFAQENSDEWKMVWNDEFEGEDINMDYWSYDVPENGRWNGEIQSYTENNAFIEDGKLILEARKEDITEPDGEVYNYSSAKLITKDKQTWTYGKVEVRAKMPGGQGIWPAIWMMPNDEPFYGTWPVSGEIDIMELLGHNPDTVHGTVHFGEPHQELQGTYKLKDGKTFTDDFYTYTIEWEPGEIRWYIDGELYHTANDWFTKDPGNADDYTYPAPFDQPFFLIMNISVGGGWPGNPDETTVFPQQMAVDYVRVYEKDEYTVHPKPEKNEAEDMRQPLEDGNYIYNGDFSSGEDYWEFLKDGAGDATLDINDQTMHVKINSGGNVEHGVQLLQSPVPLIKGAKYRASFSAMAESERQMKVKIGADGSRGWADYANEAPVTLTDSWTDYAFEFTMEEKTDIKARYEFNLGNNDSDVMLKNVRLEKIADPEPVDPSTVVREPLPSGNLIYNGTFDQGTDRMGFWEFTTNENAEAAKYIGSGINERRFDARIVNGGTSVDAIQLTQSGFSLENGREYILTFDASAEEVRDIQVVVTNAENDIVSEDVLSLTTDTEKYSVRFVMDNENDNNSALTFNLGANDQDVSIDNVSLDKQPLEIEVDNILTNGIFDSLSGWRAEAYNPGEATSSVVNGQVKVNMTNIGDADWNVQLFQQGVKLEEGKTYELSFDARSTVDRPLRLQIQRNGEEDNIWTGYFDQTVELNDSMQTFTFTFTMEELTDLSAKFGFALGKDENGLTPSDSHDVYIDNVLLKEAGDEGTGDEGTGDEGSGDEGTGDEGTRDEGTGDEGSDDEGTGDEVKLELEKGQIQSIKANQVVTLKDSKVTIEMPFNLPEGATIMIDSIEQLENLNNGYVQAGDVIDVTLEGAEGASVFKLELGYDSKYEEVSVFYYNESTGKWVEVGGEMNEEKATITVMVDHFSTYGVFAVSPKGNDQTDDSNTVQDEDDDALVNDETDADDDSKLPDTATNTVSFLLIGMMLVVAGTGLFFTRKKKLN